MATLYTQSSSNIRKTWFLITVFLVLIIGIGWVFSQIYSNPGILVIAVIFSALMSFVSYWYSDKIALAIAAAKPIEKKDNPVLYRTVENLCITAGLPTPKIYIIPEAAPNAFATGRDARHAVVAVTAGLLQKLDKPELEGVIAHELSHIGNRDILLSSVVVVLVGFVALLSNWFMRSMWFGGMRSRANNREGNQLGGILMLVGVVLAILSPIIAMLTQLAISRKREFLADASGALLTRYPEGLARALEKITSDKNTLSIANNATAHLYIASPFKGKSAANWLTKLFMTHPPIEERIRILRQMSL